MHSLSGFIIVHGNVGTATITTLATLFGLHREVTANEEAIVHQRFFCAT